MNDPIRYRSYFDLAKREKDDHYRILLAQRNSSVLVFTPHGGGIEPGTSEIVCAIAGIDFSYYCFEGTKRDGNDGLHITSTHFDEPDGLQMIANADVILTVHGCGGRSDKVFLGGLHAELVERFIAVFQETGFNAERGYGRISGKNPRNICNRGHSRMGVQMELSEGLRREMFLGLDSAGRKHSTVHFDRFISAARSLLLEKNLG